MAGVALLHTFSLAGIAEGWDDTCQIVWRAIKYSEVKALRDLGTEKMTEDQAADKIIEFIKEHVVSAKGMVFDDNGQAKLADMSKDDVGDLPLDILMNLFNEMNGGKLDPKGGEKAVQSETPQAPSDLPTTTL